MSGKVENIVVSEWCFGQMPAAIEHKHTHTHTNCGNQ